MRLKGASSFSAIFGALQKGDAKAMRSELRKQFSYLARVVHPDHAPPPVAAEAAEAFRLLNELRHAAEDAIEKGAYDAPITPRSTASTSAEVESSEIVTSRGSYRLKQKAFREGDFSVLYRGTFAGAKPIAVLAKIAREPAMNSWLEREAVLLRHVADAKPKTPLFAVSPFLPSLIDSVLLEGERGTRYRANLYRFVPDLVSVADIMTAYPRGLDAPQAAWVARRIYAQVLAASMLGVVHGSITPDHVLVNPFTHEPLHIGWPHAERNGRITHVIDRWKDIYPPEVFDKKEADFRTDIFMASATIVRLLGGDVGRKSVPASVPKEVAQLVLRGLEKSPARRPQDGRLLLDEFTRVVRKQWGMVYRPLTMPIH